MTTLEQTPQSNTPELLEQPIDIPLPEVIPTPENESELLQQRIELAIGDCEIEPTAEVREAIHGWYGDHYALGSMIEASVNGEVTDEQLEAILESPDGVVTTELDSVLDHLDKYDGGVPTPPSAEIATRLLAASIKRERLAKTPEERDKQHAKTLRIACSAISEVIFQENSLGITTISNPEIEQVRFLHSILSETISVTDDSELIDLENTENRINLVKSNFWEDVRYAGQLEFHNTGTLEEVAKGGLMSRTEQFRRHGYMRAGTESDNTKMHSVVPHFGESYMPGFYSGLNYNMPNPNQGDGHGSGTVAIPLAEIIKIAPFARDARYAVVRPRTADVISKVPMRTAESISAGTAGGKDDPNSSGVDRVFFASATQEGGVIPDAYSIPIDSEHGATLMFFGESYQDSEYYGLGQGMASRLHIESHDSALQQVSALQDKYLNNPKYEGRLVVPLRRGVFDYQSEGMGRRPLFYRKAPNYNQNPLLQKQAVA